MHPTTYPSCLSGFEEESKNSTMFTKFRTNVHCAFATSLTALIRPFIPCSSCSSSLTRRSSSINHRLSISAILQKQPYNSSTFSTDSKDHRSTSHHGDINQKLQQDPVVHSSTPVNLSKDEADAHISHTLNRIKQHPIVLCIRENSSSRAYQAASAALRAAPICIEVTLTTPNALSIIDSLRLQFPNAIIGAGTVLTSHQVSAVSKAGAAFIMSPITDQTVVHAAHHHGMLAIPGAATPTEIFNAFHHVGAKVVKVFPISACGGAAFVNAMNGPLGHIPLLPTSGVELDQLEQYIKMNNILGVGASKQIIIPKTKDMSDDEWEEQITNRTKQWIDIVRQARQHSSSSSSSSSSLTS